MPPGTINTTRVNGEKNVVDVTVPTQALVTHTAASLESLLRRAAAGDEAVVPELRSLLEQSALVELFGNLARRVETEIVIRLAERDLTIREALFVKLAHMR